MHKRARPADVIAGGPEPHLIIRGLDPLMYFQRAQSLILYQPPDGGFLFFENVATLSQHFYTRATPLFLAASATAFATAGPTRLSNAAGMI